MGLFGRSRGPQAAVSGTVTVGGRGAGGQVLRFDGETGSRGASTTIRPESAFAARIPAGGSKVRLVWKSLRFPEETVLEAGSIRVEGGESKTLSLEVPAGTLNGRVRREPGGPGAAEVTVRVEFTGPDGPTGHATRVTGSDGTFQVRPAPVGTACVIVDGARLAEVSVTAGGTAKVEAALEAASPAPPA